MIKALELAPPPVFKELMYWKNSVSYIPEEKINSVKEILLKLRINEITEKKIDHYYHQSMNILEKIELAKALKCPLESLIGNMLKRNS